MVLPDAWDPATHPEGEGPHSTMKLPIITGLVALIAVLGVAAYTTNFTTYLGDDPTTCNNCHVMDGAYEGWFHAGHGRVASCNDCHVPHDFFGKYTTKAISGFNHVYHFTTGNIPVPIRAKDSTKAIIQANCIRCHTETVSAIADGQMDSERYCVACHRDVAHGECGLSLLPYQDTTTVEIQHP